MVRDIRFCPLGELERTAREFNEHCWPPSSSRIAEPRERGMRGSSRSPPRSRPTGSWRARATRAESIPFQTLAVRRWRSLPPFPRGYSRRPAGCQKPWLVPCRRKSISRSLWISSRDFRFPNTVTWQEKRKCAHPSTRGRRSRVQAAASAVNIARSRIRYLIHSPSASSTTLRTPIDNGL